MPSLNDVTQPSLPIIAAGLLAVVSGCGTSPSNEYHAIDRVAAKPTAPIDGNTGTVPAADALQAENSAMMSIGPERMSASDDFAVSALKVENPRPIEILIPHKTFSKDRKTGAFRITYDDLNLWKILNMDPVTANAVSLMPSWLRSLDGQSVRVRGFMYPPFQAEGLEGFVLLRDNQECCYGPGAKIYDHITIKMKDGVTARYVPIKESLEVVGRFKIDLDAAGDSIYQLYIIEDATVVGR